MFSTSAPRRGCWGPVPSLPRRAASRQNRPWPEPTKPIRWPRRPKPTPRRHGPRRLRCISAACTNSRRRRKFRSGESGDDPRLAAAAALALFAAPAGAAEYPLHAGDRAVGEVQYILAESGDNLADIARQADIGYTEMLAANRGVDPWSPALRTLAIPGFFILPDAPREGIVINLAERRLYYFPRNGETVQTYPI